MQDYVARRFITAIYELAFRRVPSAAELEIRVPALVGGKLAPETLLANIMASDEFRIKKGVRTQFPTGHFHSPVVDPGTVSDYLTQEILLRPDEIAGMQLDVASMYALWLDNLDFVQTTPFGPTPTVENRYGYSGGPFPIGDGIALRMMIRNHRPKRIIEIGSGFSTACMLDSAKHAGLVDMSITCIDPNTARLRRMLRKEDHDRVEIIEAPVQAVDPAIVDILAPNDILFIDSTHVVKTGSDVHFEFFRLLPRLRAGVIVHFHDVMYPFEYPRKWVVEDNYSWNEAYFLRSFLMYNQAFSVVFWNSLFARYYSREVSNEFAPFLQNPGGSIWLKRM